MATDLCDNLLRLDAEAFASQSLDRLLGQSHKILLGHPIGQL